MDGAACATFVGFMTWGLLTWLSLKYTGGYVAIYHPCFKVWAGPKAFLILCSMHLAMQFCHGERFTDPKLSPCISIISLQTPPDADNSHKSAYVRKYVFESILLF